LSTTPLPAPAPPPPPRRTPAALLPAAMTVAAAATAILDDATACSSSRGMRSGRPTAAAGAVAAVQGGRHRNGRNEAADRLRCYGGGSPSGATAARSRPRGRTPACAAARADRRSKGGDVGRGGRHAGTSWPASPGEGGGSSVPASDRRSRHRQ